MIEMTILPEGKLLVAVAATGYFQIIVLGLKHVVCGRI